MKRIMEEATTRHVEALHYSASARIRVGGERGTGSGVEAGFWLFVLEGFSGKKLKNEKADRTEKQVQEVTGWNDSVEEKTNLLEAACQNYEVLC